MRASVQEECSGCGGDCVEETSKECRGPEPVPWLPFDRCMMFYEARSFDAGPNQEQRFQIRITYEHCLRLIGRQQGALLYTVTLLPGEEVRVFEFDRFRRVRSDTQRVSVHASFRQTLSALSQAWASSSTSAYFDVLSEARTRSDSSVSVGGGLAGFFGLPSGSSRTTSDAGFTIASGSATQTALSHFTMQAVMASQSMDAERSIVVSRFEDAEHQSTTSRTLKNANHCHAVTYFVRRVNEVYEVTTRVVSIEWRIGNGPWHVLEDVDGLGADLHKLLERLRGQMPRIGDVARDERQITLMTDGTLYEAELAHCSSCEPVREAEERVCLERLRLAARRECLETELLALEIERRRGLSKSAEAAPLALEPWRFGSSAAQECASTPEESASSAACG